MKLNALTAVSPIDGRYRNKIEALAPYFSEFGLIHYRVRVEIEYFIALMEEELFTCPKEFTPKALRAIYQNFNLKDAETVKEIERSTNHDVKAVEYFIKGKLELINKKAAKEVEEWVHFGLTSQDINNTAIPLSWKEALEMVYLPGLKGIIKHLKSLAKQWEAIPMLARTHGQPASPTRLGKEFGVFVERLENQVELFEHLPYTGKFGGATGNFNAHQVAFPEKDWVSFANRFLDEQLGLERLQLTTQIAHYDNLGAQFDTLKRINTILIDLCRDIWTYISEEYFRQKTKAGETGSSTMPHKVNPIDFENAEGNLGIANALFEHLSAKLPISRLQRDLTDSTVLRNIGVPISHGMIALQSLEKGLGKLILNEEALDKDLEANWAVVAEAIQTILRREQYPKPYEALKELTRGKGHIDKKTITNFIKSLKVTKEVKKELLAITPKNYVGI